jgi:hypothetical protein
MNAKQHPHKFFISSIEARNIPTDREHPTALSS